jgi:hypothetical protein
VRALAGCMDCSLGVYYTSQIFTCSIALQSLMQHIWRVFRVGSSDGGMAGRDLALELLHQVIMAPTGCAQAAGRL